MDWRRYWRHVAMTPWAAAKAFPEATLSAIGEAVAAHERLHRGEIRFVVEAELTTGELWQGVTARQRAEALFASHRVWDTAARTGVLVYVLLADHAVEIVADRGITAAVPQPDWEGICARMVACYRQGRFEAGSLDGVTAIAALLERHFPATGENANQLPDRPVRI